MVYLARDPRVARKVAIKTYSLPPGLTPEQESEFRERFMREAQAAGALNHPAIVTIYDADDDPDSRIPFIAMEYVDGQSLADLLSAQGCLPAEVAFEQAEAVADALHEAHTLGIVHRDIKPANLLIPAAGSTVKVADFGVARMASSDLTRTGHSLGSPAYMAPEQVKGEHADGRSDLFSLAVVLYEALCGERPFAGDNPTALAYAVVHGTPVAISKRRTDLPSGIDAFFDRALAKDPSARFADGHAFRDALRVLRAGVKPTATLVFLEPEEGGAEESQDGEPPLTLDYDTPAASPRSGQQDTYRGPWVRGVEAGVILLAGAWQSLMRWRSEKATRRRPPAQKSGESRTATSVSRPRVTLEGRRRARRTHRAGEPARSAWRRSAIPLAAVLIAVGVVVTAAWNADPQRATLLVDGRNSYRSARLTVFVDGEAVYSRSLSARKKQAAFMGKRLFEYGDDEEFGGRIRVAPGRIEITAEIVPEGESQPFRQTLVVRLEPGERRTLAITAGKGGATPLRLALAQ